MRRLALLAFLFSACHSVIGCAESSFKLAADSRLPKWFFRLADASSRDRYTVTMDLYVLPAGRSATFKLWDEHGRKIAQLTASLAGLEPLTLGPPKIYGQPYDDRSYPLFEVMTADGVAEVIEFGKEESLFRVNSDPSIRTRLFELLKTKPD